MENHTATNANKEFCEKSVIRLSKILATKKWWQRKKAIKADIKFFCECLRMIEENTTP